MKRKNGFTLIELLAIIVILAIIAVITVPIILGIIEDASENAAKDSAYGFKDSVNKYYAQQLLNNQNLKLNDTYTVTNGTLSGGDFGDSNITSLPIQVSGTVPTSGTLTYSNNKLTSGCLKIGDYAVTFNNDGSTTTVKGECPLALPTFAEMCPGCKFIFTEDLLTAGTSGMPENATDDYTNWTTGANGHKFFLGLIESETDEGIIGRAFACGIEGTTPFCIEGTDDGTKFSYNTDLLDLIYTNCSDYSNGSIRQCVGEWSGIENDYVTEVTMYSNGGVYVGDGSGSNCSVNGLDAVLCGIS